MKANKRPHAVWLRCARLVVRHYKESKSETAERPRSPELANLVDGLGRLRRKLSLASNRGWEAAKRQVNEDCRRQLVRIREHADAELSAERDISTFEVNEIELFRDLHVLSHEFSKVEFDPKAKRLSAVTKDITLDDCRLGAFKIVLHLDSVSTSKRTYYEVIAIEPNRPSSNDDVTHPHIQDDRLCEGDAQPAIGLALRQGRLLDFFQIVEQVLGSYNPSSAYVTIREWDGSTCNHCGYSADPDESRECGGCEAFICDSCVYRCSDCDDTFCGNCEHACGGCLESICKSCVSTCSECDGPFCSDCLTENERCNDCEKKAKEDSNEGTGATDAEVHSDGVGEAVVLA
jgi:hypothetical protein